MMASLTLKGIPSDLMQRLREIAERERRSLNQQAILILERALSSPRHSFSDAYDAFADSAGPSPLESSDFDNLRDPEEGRSVTL